MTRNRTSWSGRHPIDKDHAKLRAKMLPAAIGTVCPSQISPDCVGVMSESRRMQLDHIIERALGGQTTAANCRIICAPCNHLRGSQLGGRVTRARRHDAAVQAKARRLPQW